MGLSMSPLSNVDFAEPVSTDTLKILLSLGTSNISVKTRHGIPEQQSSDQEQEAGA